MQNGSLNFSQLVQPADRCKSCALRQSKSVSRWLGKFNMYTDASSNPITAMQGVELVLAPLQEGLASGAFRLAPRYQYDTTVSLAAYHQLQRQYMELLAVAEAGMAEMTRLVARQSREIVQLKSQLHRR